IRIVRLARERHDRDGDRGATAADDLDRELRSRARDAERQREDEQAEEGARAAKTKDHGFGSFSGGSPSFTALSRRYRDRAPRAGARRCASPRRVSDTVRQQRETARRLRAPWLRRSAPRFGSSAD